MQISTNDGGSAEYVGNVAANVNAIWYHFAALSNELSTPKIITCPSDGKVTETCEILWIDRKNRWARTRSRLWLLGESEGSEIAADGGDL